MTERSSNVEAANPRDALFAALIEAALTRPGALPPEVRGELAAGEFDSLPDEARTYLTKVAGPSYASTDDEVASLARAIGEEGVFEATIAIAVGAARRQVDAAMTLVEGRS
jgi:hypothetical protein